MTAIRLVSALALALAAGSALAGTAPSPVPEPATWALAGLAAAIGYAVSKRRK